ncbi:MAG: hypothetical protein NTV24_04560 [Candidatus Woesebacteria bacterium]|nr:hypothetical protein [Candidatus Woesebacteria bacterium]
MSFGLSVPNAIVIFSVLGNLSIWPSPKTKPNKNAKLRSFFKLGYDEGINPIFLALIRQLEKLSIFFLLKVSEIFFTLKSVYLFLPLHHGGGRFFKLSRHFKYLGSFFGNKHGEVRINFLFTTINYTIRRSRNIGLFYHLVAKWPSFAYHEI